MTTTTEEVMTIEEHERRMAEFRAKVRAEAMEMARRHNLCSTVEETLHKVGIDNGIRYVTITRQEQITQTLKVPEDLIFGMDEAALAKAAKQYVEGKLPNSRAWNSVEQINYVTSPVGEVTVSMVDGLDTYDQRYSSSEGRVKHLVRLIGTDSFEDEALCGAEFREEWNRWPEYSARGENRLCANCEVKFAKVSAA